MLAHGFTTELLSGLCVTGSRALRPSTWSRRAEAGDRKGEDHGGGAAGVGHQRLRLMYGIR